MSKRFAGSNAEGRLLLLAAFALISAPSTSYSQQQRLCICSLPEIPVCAKACGEPPKQEFKLVTVSKSIVPTTLGAIGYEPVFPAIPGGASKIDELLADPKTRSTIKGELEGRAATALEQKKALEAALQKASPSSAAVKAAIADYEKDAQRFQAWGGKIGAAEARSRIGSDLKF